MKRARIDFQFSINLSMDIKLDLVDPKRISIYEIKTG